MSCRLYYLFTPRLSITSQLVVEKILLLLEREKKRIALFTILRRPSLTLTPRNRSHHDDKRWAEAAKAAVGDSG